MKKIALIALVIVSLTVVGCGETKKPTTPAPAGTPAAK